MYIELGEGRGPCHGKQRRINISLKKIFIGHEKIEVVTSEE